MLSCLSQADAIIHGGDINTQAIVDTLQGFVPLYIVRGNNDKEWAKNLPHSLTFTIEGVHFFLLHNKRDVPLDLSDVDVVIYGHSHLLCCLGQPLFTKTHGRREVAFLNRAWDDVIAAELALDESTQSQPLLDQIVNAKPSRCVGFEGLGTASERLADTLNKLI